MVQKLSIPKKEEIGLSGVQKLSIPTNKKLDCLGFTNLVFLKEEVGLSGV